MRDVKEKCMPTTSATSSVLAIGCCGSSPASYDRTRSLVDMYNISFPASYAICVHPPSKATSVNTHGSTMWSMVCNVMPQHTNTSPSDHVLCTIAAHGAPTLFTISFASSVPEKLATGSSATNFAYLCTPEVCLKTT